MRQTDRQSRCWARVSTGMITFLNNIFVYFHHGRIKYYLVKCLFSFKSRNWNLAEWTSCLLLVLYSNVWLWQLRSISAHIITKILYWSVHYAMFLGCLRCGVDNRVRIVLLLTRWGYWVLFSNNIFAWFYHRQFLFFSDRYV